MNGLMIPWDLQVLGKGFYQNLAFPSLTASLYLQKYGKVNLCYSACTYLLIFLVQWIIYLFDLLLLTVQCLSIVSLSMHRSPWRSNIYTNIMWRKIFFKETNLKMFLMLPMNIFASEKSQYYSQFMGGVRNIAR